MFARAPIAQHLVLAHAEQIRSVWHENRAVYGVPKVWNQLKREGPAVACCTVARLIQQVGLAGMVRGRTFKVTTMPDPTGHESARLGGTGFTAARPNQLWVADLTYCG